MTLKHAWAVAAWLLVPTAHAATFRFDAPRAIEAGHVPTAAELWDLDGDADLDLVVVDRGVFNGNQWVEGGVRVFLNPADGSFDRSEVYAVPDAPWSLAVCDVDRDGAPDVVTPNAALADNLTVLLNDGQGAFVPGDVIPVGIDPLDVVCVDLDADGYPDLASADQFGFGVSVAANAGDGTFESAVFYPLNDFVNGIEAGDLDGDGDRDLVAFTNDHMVVLRNLGTGAFSVVSLPTLGASPLSRLCRIDADAALDLVSGSRVWLGSGNGLFDPDFVSTGLSDGPVRCCDTDGDGDTDVVTGAGIAVSNGDGTFGGTTLLMPTLESGDVACGDYLEDGALDLVRLHGVAPELAGLPLGFATLLPGLGGGSFPLLARYPAGDSVWKMSAARVDPDEHLDLIVGNVGTPFPIFDNGSIAILAGHGDGSLDPFLSYPAGDRVRSIDVADLDEDDDPDVVAGNFDDDVVRVLRNDGTGTLDLGTTEPVQDKPEAIATGDFDGVNGPDLAVGHHTDPGRLAVLLADGAGGFAPLAAQQLPGHRVIDLLAAHLDGNGDLDLAALFLGQPTGGVPWPGSGLVILLGQGDGTFVASPLHATTLYNPRDLDACDIDGDADLDWVVFTSGSDATSTLIAARLEVFLNDGRGGLSEAPVVTELRNDAFDVRCSDVNGDGRPDVVVPYSSSSVVTFLPGLGDGTFGRATHFETGVSPRALAIGEIDSDAHGDVAAAHSGSNDVSVLLNQCALPSTLVVGADKISFVWTPECVAASYNVYRGDLVELVDLDENGLPDLGYGTCVNDADDSPDTVFDTIFIDPATPGSSEGFTYLVSYDGPEGEAGLGTTSGGLARFVTIPCP